MRGIVITGGPGSGKTTLLEQLHARGEVVVAESGRDIIRQQLTIDGRALPWRDRSLFAAQMFNVDVRTYRESATRADTVFFDRGLVDTIGYLRLEQLPVPAHMEEAAWQLRYFPLVFIAPFWAEIYHRDEHRAQSALEAELTCQAMFEAYRHYGYRIVELPLVNVEQRIAFIDQLLDLQSND